jgi:hypothetical protein
MKGSALVLLRRITVLATCIAAPFLSGCATIIKGSHQEIPVASDPSNASVLVDGVRQGYTPTKLNLARKGTYVVSLELEGHESESITVKPSIGGAVAGNIIAGGLIGWGVDAGTGAQYNLHPDSINIRLRTRAELVAPPKSAIDEMLRELAKLDSLKAEGKVSDEEYSSLRSGILKRYQ